MSGSPIIQDGKLVGAVTHGLVNDPTQGNGIFIENMLDAAGSVLSALFISAMVPPSVTLRVPAPPNGEPSGAPLRGPQKA